MEKWDEVFQRSGKRSETPHLKLRLAVSWDVERELKCHRGEAGETVAAVTQMRGGSGSPLRVAAGVLTHTSGPHVWTSSCRWGQWMGETEASVCGGPKASDMNSWKSQNSMWGLSTHP